VLVFITNLCAHAKTLVTSLASHITTPSPDYLQQLKCQDSTPMQPIIFILQSWGEYKEAHFSDEAHFSEEAHLSKEAHFYLRRLISPRGSSFLWGSSLAQRNLISLWGSSISLYKKENLIQGKVRLPLACLWPALISNRPLSHSRSECLLWQVKGWVVRTNAGVVKR
jgi:hypothetical protein